MLVLRTSSTAARRALAKFHRSPKRAKLGLSAFDVQLFLDSGGLGRTVRKFPAKEAISTQGDPASQVMYIQDGSVKLTVVSEGGKEAVVAVLGLGDFFGEGCLAGQSLCMATATMHLPPCSSSRKTR